VLARPYLRFSAALSLAYPAVDQVRAGTPKARHGEQLERVIPGKCHPCWSTSKSYPRAASIQRTATREAQRPAAAISRPTACNVEPVSPQARFITKSTVQWQRQRLGILHVIAFDTVTKRAVLGIDADYRTLAWLLYGTYIHRHYSWHRYTAF
jgi:hypothetical protein